MNNLNFIKQILAIALCTLLISCGQAQTNESRLPDPQIKSGIARLFGKVINYQLQTETPVVKLGIPHPITAETVQFETELKEDGTFYFEVPVECNVNIGYLDLSNHNSGFYVCLSSEMETKLEFIYDESGVIKISDITGSIGLTCDDLNHMGTVVKEMYMHKNPDSMRIYIENPDKFAQMAMKGLKLKLEIAQNNSHLSIGAKNYVSSDFKLAMLIRRLLDYKGMVYMDYKNFMPEEERDNFIAPPEPDKSYYTFLQLFNLNDPQYLYSAAYSDVLQVILSNDTLNIPAINEAPIDKWMMEVKESISELVGFETGQFYDMLAVNAYAKQFNDKLEPLSEKQKENIKTYWANGEIAKILLRKNEEIIRLAKEKSALVVNETPVVPKEKLMETIISKYKGKAVVVDFWATWCGPCLESMKEMNPLKQELKDKNVVYLYITGSSSPVKLWEEKINSIGGDHYYLNREEWEYLLEYFDFTRIPTYLFYDSAGVLKNKVTAYPGTEEMRKMIEEIL